MGLFNYSVDEYFLVNSFIVVHKSGLLYHYCCFCRQVRKPKTVLIPSYVRSHQNFPDMMWELRGLLVSDTLEPPTNEERFDQVVIELKRIEQANQLLKEWGCIVPAPPSWAGHQIIKFPRTRHVVNVGAATRDDLICQKENRSSISTLQYMSRRK